MLLVSVNGKNKNQNLVLGKNYRITSMCPSIILLVY